MNLLVTEQEREILARLINREITELGTEIRHTDTRDFRENLKEYRHQLETLAERLAGSTQGARI